MTTYTIVPTTDGTGFHIGVAGSNGARQTMLGFTSKQEAEAWIIQDKRLNGDVAAQPQQAPTQQATTQQAPTQQSSA
ncbi:hypothetical protein [Rhodopila sp.]|uniref:hypothetical protein n=1 Tax=Rhodopila sp. TaxID=2480087 RepID=UPI003D0BFED3